MRSKAKDSDVRILGLFCILMVLTVLISGCVSQAPKVIDQEPDLGVEDESDIDSQIADLEDLTDDIDDSDLVDIEESLDSVDWE